MVVVTANVVVIVTFAAVAALNDHTKLSASEEFESVFNWESLSLFHAYIHIYTLDARLDSCTQFYIDLHIYRTMTMLLPL